SSTPGMRDIAVLAVVSVVAGYAYGALLDVWDWTTFYRGSPSFGFLPGAGTGVLLQRFGRFYLATSVVWDSFRAAGDALAVIVLGLPVLAALARVKSRLTFTVSGPGGPAARVGGSVTLGGALLAAPGGVVRLEQLQKGVRRERLRTEDAGSRPDLGLDQLERGQRVDRRLPHHRLRPVLGHRGGVVHHVIEIHLTRLAVLPGAAHQRAGAGQAGHAIPQAGGIGQARGHNVARRDPAFADLHRGGRVQSELVQRLEDADELVAQPVLEGDPPAIDPARHQEHL